MSETLVVSSRGQITLPAALRKRLGIKSGLKYSTRWPHQKKGLWPLYESTGKYIWYLHPDCC
jgi:hypothetical protein